MKIHNLGKNILFQICRELSKRGRCHSLEARFVYDTFADIPGKNIDESIRSLVQHGWLRKVKRSARVILTAEGHAAISTMIPALLREDCFKPAFCHH